MSAERTSCPALRNLFLKSVTFQGFLRVTFRTSCISDL